MHSEYVLNSIQFQMKLYSSEIPRLTIPKYKICGIVSLKFLE